jgi:hypothetical protein
MAVVKPANEKEKDSQYMMATAVPTSLSTKFSTKTVKAPATGQMRSMTARLRVTMSVRTPRNTYE